MEGVTGGFHEFIHQRVPLLSTLTQQKRDIHPMLYQCWPTVYDGGPTLIQHCLLGMVVLAVNPYNAEIFLYKPWRPKDFFQFEIIVNVLLTSFCFI